MKRLFIFLLILIGSCSFSKYPEFTEKSADLYYQRLELGEGIPYHPDSCFLDYTVQYYPVKDSANKEIKEIKFARLNPEILADSILKNVKKGDHLRFITNNKNSYLQSLCMEENPLNENDYFIDLKIDEVYNLYLQEEDPNVLEYKSINAYFSLISSPDLYHYYKGIWIKWLERSAEENAKVKGEIVLDYAGYSLEGEARDIPDFPLQFNTNDQYQVVKGIELAISQMNYTDSVMVIIPSYLAFGELGSKNGNIPPYSALLYYLKAYTPKAYYKTHPPGTK